ncbi:hypothetical protein HYC85_028814 [Camellia sinensis]|uniref:Uncharacterized protein n=1 Tax=Camellia sinensis TaxID=4442 RepID=A0A7J7FW68_CAMSI|nr:hypothetical protein HYC85_028814 [Camellia sinensis]
MDDSYALCALHRHHRRPQFPPPPPLSCFVFLFISSKVISNMWVLMTEDSNNAVSSSFLLDNDSSIPFSVDDISKSMDQIDISDIEPPPLIRENSGFSFLLPRAD